MDRDWRREQQGLTLVELLVAMAISVTVMSGVIVVLLTSKLSFITQGELAVLQENARYAMRLMAEELRMAGFSGCSSKPLFTANSIVGATDSWFLNAPGIHGFEHEAGVSSFPAEFGSDVKAGTDAILIRRAQNTGYSVAAHIPEKASFKLNQPHELKTGEIMVVADARCQQLGVFQISDAQAAGATIEHNSDNPVTSNEVSPGNCSQSLRGNVSCQNPPTPGTLGEPYTVGSRMMSLSSQAFYVGISELGGDIPALYRERLDYADGKVRTVAQELLQGVENLQILYGVDTLNNDGRADSYMKAHDAALNWDAVVSVRIALRVRSMPPVHPSEESYDTFQDVVGSDGSDRYLRKDVTTTLQLRN